MSKSIANAVKRIKQEARIAKAYAMNVEFKDMVKNDESVKKFFEQFKSWQAPSRYCIIGKRKKMKTFYFFSCGEHKFIGQADATDWMVARKIVADATGFPIDNLLPYSSKSIWEF